MPETAPLDVNETTVGYELDSITLRNIASVRYIRHHEWLDHLLENPIPTSDIVPPQIGESFDAEAIDNRIKEAEKEIAALELEESNGWKFYLNEKKSLPLIEATRNLKSNFGVNYTEQCKQEIESKLGMKIVPSTTMSPVPITYDRRAIDLANAQRAKEQQHQMSDEEVNGNETGSNQAVEQPQMRESIVSNSPMDSGADLDNGPDLGDDGMDVESYI